MKEKKKMGRPLKYQPDELLQKASEYFKHCNETIVKTSYGKEITKPKTLSGLCLWLKVSKDYISEKIKDDNFSEMIKLIRLEVENDIEMSAMLGFINTTIASKNLSANFNWKDKSEVDNTNLNIETDMSEIGTKSTKDLEEMRQKFI